MPKNDLMKSIIEELPQIPYVIDQVVVALDWAKETLTEGEYNKVLRVAYKATEYTKKISNPNFFKTHLITALILSNIEGALENEKFSTFDTASKATEKALRALTVDKEQIEARGCFKAILLHLIPLAKTNEDLFALSLIGIKEDIEDIVIGLRSADVKTPITAQDYVTILGYTVVMDNIRMANLNLLNNTYEIYNSIVTLLNELSY
jgi:hypothetical protein